MCISLAVLVIELAIIARSSHSDVADFEDGLQLLVDGKRVLDGLVDADTSSLHAGAFAL